MPKALITQCGFRVALGHKRKGLCIGNTSCFLFTEMLIKFWENVIINLYIESQMYQSKIKDLSVI